MGRPAGKETTVPIYNVREETDLDNLAQVLRNGSTSDIVFVRSTEEKAALYDAFDRHQTSEDVAAFVATEQQQHFKQFVIDMLSAGHEVRSYSPRGWMGKHCPAVTLDEGYGVDDVQPDTDVPLSWDSLGNCVIVHPLHQQQRAGSPGR
jgi:hypothetical protein